ncbi:tyrosine-type recombinase/integrase [Paraburkholderia sp. JPY169]|uniref:Tyrosine-type recombinase/integrase n=1 Tax=Paraburkholderia youngii TaxID=2782701 RepID=A0A7Y6N3L5_9BURK|nr:tyrosine-type recombinase/integrase [Paraburkholderia youngii]
MTQAQRIGHVPPNAQQHHVQRVMQAFEYFSHTRTQLLGHRSRHALRPVSIADRLITTDPKIVTRAGQQAGLAFPVHPHMLRHATGYKLANDGHDTRAIQHYLGHRNIQHTTRYTELASDRFRDFWQD